MSGGQKSGSERPAAARRPALSQESTYSAPSWEPGTRPRRLWTNPSFLRPPHLPAGEGLDPGISGKGHLGPKGDTGGWGWGGVGQKVPISQDTSS